jgi:hypothetical protein
MPRRHTNDKPEAGAEDTPCETAISPRAGLPDPNAVVSEEEFTSPMGGHYRVLHTTEMDAYDESVSPPPDGPVRPPPKRPGRSKARPPSGD